VKCSFTMLMLLAVAAPLVAADAPGEAVSGSQPYQLRGGLVLRMGAFEVFALIDRESSYPARMIGGKQTPEQWARARHLLTPNGHLRSPLGGYLIRKKANNRLVLVDLGMGPYAAPPTIPPGEHRLIEELAAVGYKPQDITDIVLTHLHLDHAGWASVDGKSTFPNARYWVHQAEWEHTFVNPPPGQDGEINPAALLTRSVLKPIEPQLNTYKAASATVYPGLTIRHVPGHTPGSSIVQLESGGRRALILGDTAHSAMSLQDKSWPGSFDVDEAQCLEAKNALIDEAIATDAAVSASHVSGMRFGYIVDTPTKGLVFYYNER
jgi:glyoxylase-like metal-dependent hydrolase (beta-lactamase superfamily II)